MKPVIATLAALLIGSAGAQQTKFIFEHGIGGSRENFEFTSPTGCADGSFCAMVRNPARTNVAASDHNTRDAGGNLLPGVQGKLTFEERIPTQAERTRQTILNHAAGQPYVLVGLSQGGVRARWVAQQLAGNDARIADLRAIVTYDTPHAGAPIVRNLPAYRAELDSLVRGGSFHTRSLDQMLGELAGQYAGEVGTLLNLTGNEAGAQDLAPESQFNQDLNGIEQCRTESRQEWRWGTLFPYLVTVNYTICKKNEAFKPIPANVDLVSVWGTASDPAGTNTNTLEAVAPGIQRNVNEAANSARTQGTSLQAAGSVLCVSGFGCVVGLPMIVTGHNLHQLAGRLNNFTNDWKTRVVGSVEGDAVVPKASQLYMHDTPKIGGRQRFIVRSDAYHGEVQLPVIRRGTPWQAQNRAPEDVAKYLRDLQLP